MNKRQIARKLKQLGIEQLDAKQLASVTWIDTGHSLKIDFWNIDRVVPCQYSPNGRDLIGMSVELLWRKGDCIHSNSRDHVLKDIVNVDSNEFFDLKNQIDFLNMIRNTSSVGLRLVKGA